MDFDSMVFDKRCLFAQTELEHISCASYATAGKTGTDPGSELNQLNLSRGGDDDLITPLIVMQTYMRTVIPRWVPAVERDAPHLLQIPTLTRGDKQNSKLMKPFLP